MELITIQTASPQNLSVAVGGDENTRDKEKLEQPIGEAKKEKEKKRIFQVGKLSKTVCLTCGTIP